MNAHGTDMKERTFTLWTALGTAVVSALGGWGASYLTFKGDIEKANSAIYASNIELVKQASAIIQDDKSPAGLVNWAIDVLARYVDVPISEERRKQMVRIVTDNPYTSFEGIAERYSTELPEFKTLNNRLDELDFWKGGTGWQINRLGEPQGQPGGDVPKAPGGSNEQPQQLPGNDSESPQQTPGGNKPAIEHLDLQEN